MKKKRNKLIRCFSSYITSKNEILHKTLDFLTTQSKNIYNHYIYCYNIFTKYKKLIFQDLQKFKNDKSINENFIAITEKYYKFHCDNKIIYEKNNEIIYSYIKSKKYIVDNENIKKIYKEIKNELKKYKEIKLNNNPVFFTDIIRDIIFSFYKKNFYVVKDCLIHNKPYDNKKYTKKFIEHVKNNNPLELDIIEFVNFKKNFSKLKTKQNLIRRFAYNIIKKNLTLSSDLTINIMDRAYNSILSFYKLKEKGITANFPKYLEKEAKFILPFYIRSFKIEDNGDNKNKNKKNNKNKNKNNKNNKGKIFMRLSIGSYFKKNIKDILGKNIIIDKNKFYEKNNKNKLYDSDYLRFNICDNFKNKLITEENKIDYKRIKLVEISSQYHGNKFKINYSYEKNKKNNVKNKKGDISIDLGMKNLMTIYDPEGKQKIIKGGKLIWINNKFTYKMGNMQSEIDKSKNKEIIEKLKKKKNELYIKRENRLNNEFNLITKTLFGIYERKERIIIGYNEGWKQGVNMGKKNNGKFYKIPYFKLINKIKDKGKELGIEIKITEESYTSKCDALSLETICKHEKYLGERIKRGLFSSAKGKTIKKGKIEKKGTLINADLNGAINIMRKINKNLKEIKGKNLCNPEIIKIGTKNKKKSKVTHPINHPMKSSDQSAKTK